MFRPNSFFIYRVPFKIFPSPLFTCRMRCSSSLLSEQPAAEPCISPRPTLLCLCKQMLKYLAERLSARPPRHPPLLITLLSSSPSSAQPARGTHSWTHSLHARVGTSYFSPRLVNHCFVPRIQFSLFLAISVVYGEWVNLVIVSAWHLVL